MEKKKVFVTLFPPCENIHLIKDVGMIPYIAYKYFNFDSCIATYQNGTYPYLNTEVAGLKLRFIKKIFRNEFLDSVIYILKNSSKIDVLQVYHFSFGKLCIISLYKILSGFKGKTYIKLDANAMALNINYKGLKRKLIFFFMRFVDLISAETTAVVESLNKRNVFNKKVIRIPNGFYPSLNEDIYNKENIILTVGRIGDPNKSHHTLLEAFTKFSLKFPDWKLLLVGNIEDDFQTYINNYFEQNQNLKTKVFFLGHISDRIELNKLYSKAKIFALPSISEGFPLVFVEALRERCFLVSSNLFAAIDCTADQKFGKIFETGNSDDLSVKLTELIEGIEDINIKKYENHISQFFWKNIVGNIVSKLEK